MTGGSLGLRTGSYGSLQQQLQSSVVLPIQTPSSRKTAKMLLSSSREKERFLPWICKVAGRRRVGMLLLVIVSVVVFTSLMSAVTKDEDASDVPKTHQRSRRFQAVDPGVRVVPSYYVPPSLISREEDTKSSISTGQVTMRDNNMSSISTGQVTTRDNNMSSILSEIPLVSSENKTSPPPFTRSYTLPRGHPCEHFALPPPPADKKRIGPRPCPVCYLPVDEAMALMPNDSSISPVLKNLSYIREDTVASTQPSGGSSFGGYPTLKQRSDSFNIKESMCVHCGFVKGNRPGQQTGFDIDDADLIEMEQCRGIVVASAIFGNYDIIQQPKNISEAAKRNICFYMFVDEETEAYVKNSTDRDRTMRVGLWRIVVVKNLPYVDARRNGKVPKLLLHRIFTNARFSIWIDGKLELVVDPYQILERFLWRKGATFAISRHYRRFDVFEEAEANKVAAKYSNASIDAQIEFYKREGLTHYSHAKLPITSDVPEGCVIIREHIPITNLFTCLWFNEVDRFTSRDQLSFSTVRDKIMSKVDWSVYMFMDCERRNFVVQAYHRDILAQRMATIHPSPPPVLTTVLPKTASQEIVPEKVVSTPTKKNSAKQNSAKRGRKERTSSRRHRKVDIGRDNNSI